MQKVFFVVIAVLTTFNLISCKKKEKEKVGYEKVFNNIYKGKSFLFDFYDPAKCYIYAVWEDGTMDSVPNAIDSYQVRNDSIILTYFSGTIHQNKIVLKGIAAMAAHEYIKIN